jgi:hypothetical protein
MKQTGVGAITVVGVAEKAGIGAEIAIRPGMVFVSDSMAPVAFSETVNTPFLL